MDNPSPIRRAWWVVSDAAINSWYRLVGATTCRVAGHRPSRHIRGLCTRCCDFT